MVYVKWPTKVEGATIVIEGHNATCKADGEYNGIQKLVWKWDENGQNCNRKINGNIQVILPGGESGSTESSKEQAVSFPKLSESFEEAHAPELEMESQWVALAVKIVHERNPDLKENSGTFGQIVSATAGRLIALSTS